MLARIAFCWLLVFVAALAGCRGAARELSGEETELVAWYVEDVVHEVPRRPEELATDSASLALQRLAVWVRGRSTSTNGENPEPPRQIEARRRRWPVLRSLLQQQVVVMVEPGAVAVRPGVGGEERGLAQRIVDDENRDRAMLDNVVLALAKADTATARRYGQIADQARRQHGERVGGKVWRLEVAPAAAKSPASP